MIEGKKNHIKEREREKERGGGGFMKIIGRVGDANEDKFEK